MPVPSPLKREFRACIADVASLPPSGTAAFAIASDPVVARRPVRAALGSGRCGIMPTLDDAIGGLAARIGAGQLGVSGASL